MEEEPLNNVEKEKDMIHYQKINIIKLISIFIYSAKTICR